MHVLPSAPSIRTSTANAVPRSAVDVPKHRRQRFAARATRTGIARSYFRGDGTRRLTRTAMMAMTTKPGGRFDASANSPVLARTVPSPSCTESRQENRMSLARFPLLSSASASQITIPTRLSPLAVVKTATPSPMRDPGVWPGRKLTSPRAVKSPRCSCVP